MFDHATLDAIRRVAKSRNIDFAALAAITEVESNGIAFAAIDGRNMPLIRIEGHYFDKLVPAAKRERARKAGLASPTAGPVKNPKGQPARYAMLKRMMAIDEAAAIMSCSWGVGQVAETATYLLGIDGDWAVTIANGLLAGSAVIGTGLAVYGLYGWWRSRKTVEQG